MNRTRTTISDRLSSSGGDWTILAAGILPSLTLGVLWMRHTGVPATTYIQNVAALAAGTAVAIYGSQRHVSATSGLVTAAIAILLLLSTLVSDGVEGVHRWLRIGPLNIYVASVVIPLLLVELDRMHRRARHVAAFSAAFVVLATLVIQPDAAQATAFAGATVILVASHLRRHRMAAAAVLAIMALGGSSLLRSDPLHPVPHVEEIASRIGQQGGAWLAAVVVALALLIGPFVVETVTVSKYAERSIAVYLALVIAASYWGTFPVPILGYGMSPIAGYLLGWTWLRATQNDQPFAASSRSA